MTDRDRQADLDWLYGRSPQPAPDTTQIDPAVAAPAAATPDVPEAADQPVATPSARPRISTPTYDPDAPQPAPRPRPSPPEATARPERTATATPRRRRRLPRPLRWLRALLVLVLIWVLYLVAVPVYALGQMDRVPESSSADRPAQQPGTALLLVGSDARPDDPNFQPRADTIMLLYKPRSGPSVLVSLPRDSYVTIPGYGQTKLNAAYAYGGQPLLIDTVELATGVRIDGYLEIGFDGFAQLVDAVGGIEVCPEELVAAEIGIPPGCQVVDGQYALLYVRVRYSDPRGDIGRAERQREVINKIVQKAATPASVLNPLRYWQLNMAAAEIADRGTDTGLGDLLGGALALRDITGDDGLSLVVPIADPAGWSADGQSVVIWDHENALAMFDEITRGDTTQLGRFAG